MKKVWRMINLMFPLITAHSGSNSTVDNTMQSVEMGLKLGADYIEEDILVTKDGIPVLSHNDGIVAKDHKKYYISQLTYKELKEIDIKVDSGDKPTYHKIVTLQSMLRVVKRWGKRANLDLKSMDVIEPMAFVVKREQMTNQVILSGCEKEKVIFIQKQFPDFNRLLNVNELNLNITGNEYLKAIKDEINFALKTKCFGLNVNHLYCSETLINQALVKNLSVMIWTVNEVEKMEYFIKKGVHSITTRRVDRLVRLKERIL